MATTTRGYPLFLGGQAPAIPTHLQQLAEAIDADVTNAVGRWVKVGPPHTNGQVTGINTTAYVFPNLQLAVPVIQGRTYRVLFQVDTYSTAVTDILSIKPRADAQQLNEYSSAANSSPSAAATSIQHLVAAYYTAPATATVTFSVEIKRVAGSGNITATGATSFISVERW